MKKLFRWSLIIFATLVLLGLALSLAVLMLVDPNDYREEIATAVEQQTGRKLTIDGELSLDVFPCCGVRLGPLALGNPAGWQQEKFAEVRLAAVSVQLWPLLIRQELRAGAISLEGLDLQLISRKDGSVNWDFGTDESGAGAPDNAGGTELGGINIAGVKVREGKLVYLDNATGEEIRLSDIEFTTGTISGAQPFDFDAAMRVEGLVPDTSAQLTLSGSAVIEPQSTTLSLNDVRSRASLSGGDLPATGAELDARVASVSGLGGDRALIEGLEATVDVAGINLQLAGAGELVSDKPVLAGTIRVKQFSPRDLLAALGSDPVATADSAVLTRATLQGRWSVDDDRAALEDIQATLDDTSITGWVRVTSLAKEAAAFRLALDSVNADRYLAPESETAAAGTAGDAANGDERIDLPMDDLRALDLEGQFDIGKLEFSGARLNDVNITVTAKDGLIQLNPLTAKLYDGSYAGNVRLNVKGNFPRLSVNEKMRDVQIADLLRDASETEANITGTGNLTIKGASSGGTVNSMLKRLTGDVSFDLQDGVYSGADIWYEIRKARALLKQLPAPPKPAKPQTELKEFSGTLQFADGLLRNKDLQASLPFIRMTGSGDINLLASTLNYALQAKVVETPVFDDGEKLDNLTGLTLPVTLKGSLDGPTIGVDIGAIAVGLGQQKLKEKLFEKFGLDEQAAGQPAENATDGEQQSTTPKAEDPKDKVKDALRGLLGN